MTATLTQEKLKELMVYNKNTGEFSRLQTKGNAKKGIIPGSYTSDGYKMISVEGKKYRAHRLAFFYINGAWPEHIIDHINGIRDDNSWSNLREITIEQNSHNRRSPAKIKNRTAKYIGVSFDKNRGEKPWRASITVKDKKKFLGRYKTEEEAHQAHVEARRIHFSHNIL